MAVRRLRVHAGGDGPMIAPPDVDVVADLLRESMREGRQAGLELVSNSMWPLLARGDRIRIKACPVSALRRGAIVVLVGPEALVTHRLRAVRQDGAGRCALLTRGDRPLGFDKPWQSTQLLGCVVARERGRRRLSLERGLGAVANQVLAGIAAFEERLWGGEIDDASWDGDMLLGQRWRRVEPWRSAMRASRALLVAAGWLVVALAGRLAASPLELSGSSA